MNTTSHSDKPGTKANRQYAKYLQFSVAMLKCKRYGNPTREQLDWQRASLVRQGNPHVEQAIADLQVTFDELE